MTLYELNLINIEYLYVNRKHILENDLALSLLIRTGLS